MDKIYIRIKIIGLTGGDQWVYKPNDNTPGLLTTDKSKSTTFNETKAFEIRKLIISQLPKEIIVTFDLVP